MREIPIVEKGEREKDHNIPDHCIERILDYFEKKEFNQGIDWGTRICEGVSVEEVVGSLIHAEQYIKDVEEHEYLQNLWETDPEEAQKYIDKKIKEAGWEF